MKTLHVIRHGKAVQDYLKVSDIDRPLMEKGINNNYLIASRLIQRFSKPDLIISSPACRALHTAQIIARSMSVSENRIRIDKRLYFEGIEKILEAIYELPDQVNAVLIAGHNPESTDLCNVFCRPLINELPTSGICTLQFETDHWHELENKLTGYFIDYPKKE